MTIRHEAHARAGLLGNPSDGYFGKCIAVSVENFAATVRCGASRRLRFEPGPRDRREFESVDDLLRKIDRTGYYGGIRLLMATVRRFHAHCRERGFDLHDRSFALGYTTDIPDHVGLAGSSAIVTAAFRCLMAFHDVEIDRDVLPTLVLEVETDELGIPAGLMDRVVQVHRGLVHMDLRRGVLDRLGRGRYTSLDPGALPPLYLAYDATLAEGSEVTHDDLRRRFEGGEPEVRATMDELAALTDEGRDLLEEGRGHELGPLMDRNFDLRARICDVGEGNRRLVRTGRRLGAHPKFAGSGGAVVASYDGDPERLERLRSTYREIGAELIVPETRA